MFMSLIFLGVVVVCCCFLFLLLLYFVDFLVVFLVIIIIMSVTKMIKPSPRLNCMHCTVPEPPTSSTLNQYKFSEFQYFS